MTRTEVDKILAEARAAGKVPDLSGANLQGVGLRHAYLCGANLSGANLRKAVLAFADAKMANLSGADLREASLIGVDLRGADLSGSDLRNADLRDANLSNADITGADLRNADLRWADAVWCQANIDGMIISGNTLRGPWHRLCALTDEEWEIIRERRTR